MAWKRCSNDAVVFGCQSRKMPRSVLRGRLCSLPPGSRLANLPNASVTLPRYCGCQASTSSAQSKCVCSLWLKIPPSSSNRCMSSGVSGWRCSRSAARNSSGAASASKGNSGATLYQRCHPAAGDKTRPTVYRTESCGRPVITPSSPNTLSKTRERANPSRSWDECSGCFSRMAASHRSAGAKSRRGSVSENTRSTILANRSISSRLR